MKNNCLNVNYHHHFVSGNAYQVGLQQGKIITSVPGLKKFFLDKPHNLQMDLVHREMELLKEYFPDLIDEIQGMADALEVPKEQLVFLAQSYLPKGNCSQFLAPSDEKFFQVRNYEFDPHMDDLRLVTTAVEGKYRHLGFSVMFMGRYDGINEHGLTISMTASGIPVGVLRGMSKPANEGLQFWILIRLVLENCKTTSEALSWLEKFPICSNPIFLLSDPNGDAVLFETRGKTHQYRRMNMFSESDRMISTNHYTLPSMKPFQPSVMQNSLVRYRNIEAFLKQTPNAEINTIHQFLSKVYPEGTNCHYYEEYFGTLRTMIFSPFDRTVDICFGAPDVNDWIKFDVLGAVDKEVYPACFPMEKASPDFWRQE